MGESEREKRLKEELHASFENRAIIYYLIFDELRRELGRARAAELLKRAIYRRGEQIGVRFERHAPDDFEGLRDSFLERIPDNGTMFGPEVTRCDAGGLDITFHHCPLKEAWRGMGLDEKECAVICDIAGVIDSGTFEGAGFDRHAGVAPGRARSVQADGPKESLIAPLSLDIQIPPDLDTLAVPE